MPGVKKEVEVSRKSLKPKTRPTKQSGASPVLPDSERAIAAIVTERARFLRFVSSRIGDEATAEDVLQESLLRALQANDGLRRGESAVAWFYRILRNAISDHFRK